MTPLACPRCKSVEKVKTEPDSCGFVFVTTCDNCYDCDCDERGFFATTEQGVGDTRDESIAEWNDRVEEYEPRRAP